jgi:protocatechuate 3,4-dioxygenase beta subunit
VAVALLTLIRQPTGTTSGNTVASQTSVPAAAVAATGETQPANLTSTTPNDSLPRKTLTLKVVDGNSAAPLQRVEVKWWTFTDVLKSRSETFFTAPDGQVDLSYPVEHARDFHFRAHLAVDGYVPRHVSWSVFQHDQLEDIPSEYTAKMDRGIEIGGNVRDINNQPISDVKVIFTGPSPVGVPPRERDTVMGSYHTETTDANGAWRCNHVRPEFASTTFKLEHPFFRSVTYGCKETDQPSIGPTLLPAADFLARRAEMRMERGLIVSGVVLDESGKPIAGALVAKEREWSPKEKTRTTSAAGEFAFHDAEAGHVILTAQAEGFAPGTITTELEGAETKLTFRLQRSLGLRAKFVDQNGNPVAGAEVNPGQDGSYRKFYRWTAKSDAKGLVSWDSSPNEPLELTVFAYGIGYTNFVVKPGETLQTFTLVSKTEIHQYTIALRAIDNETKQMIPHATLHVEEHNAGGGVSPFQGAREGNNGVFKFVSSDPQARYVFEIRAAGYRPARSQLIHLAETPELDLVLEKGEAIEGTVLGPSGEPVSGASVALCSEEKGAILSTDQRFLFTDQSAVVSTDANGKFKHEPLTGAHTIYVIHQSGFAAIRLDKSQSGTTISLQPWGRIEGVAQFNGAVAGNMELGLMTHNPNGNERSLMLYTFQTMTDSQGRFVFENVPPMELKLSWMRPISRGKSYSHSMTIDVQSGATTPVIYAPEGGLVRGRFVFEDDSTIDWSTHARLVHFGVKMETPSYEQFRHDPVLAKKAYNDFWQSDEGRAWTRKQRNYAPEVRPDGTFEIPAVPPGEYVLHIQLQEKSETRIPFGKTIGTAEKSVTIPEGQTEFNLGDIVVKKR